MQKDVNYRLSVIGDTPEGRMSVIGSIPYRKDVSYRQYPTGRMSVIGSTLQEGCQL